MAFIREDQADIDVELEGTIFGDSWATVEGGNLEADDSKTRPGGMGDQVSVGGPAERQDVTATIQMSDIVLLWHKTFENAVGWGRVRVSYRFLKSHKAAGSYQTTHSIQGILKSCSLPDMDANGSDVAFYEIVVSCDERAA